MRRVAVALVGAGVALALVACSGGDDLGLPEPPPVAPTTTETTAPDYSTVQLAGVAGHSTTTIDTSPGDVQLNGTVVGPDGVAVSGATVRVQRFSGDALVTTDLASNLDGTWALPNVHGGRYRIRAWRAPDLVTASPTVMFVEAGKAQTFRLALVARYGTTVRGSIAPDPPTIDERANVVALVGDRLVDEQGIVRTSVRAGAQVQLVGSGGWVIETVNPVFTDGRGEATWQVRCQSSSAGSLSVVVDGQAYDLGLHPCTTPPPPTTAPTPSPSSPSPSSTTTTTRRGRGR